MKLEDRHEQDTAPWGLMDCYHDGGSVESLGGSRKFLVMDTETGELMWRLGVDAREGLAAGVFAPTAIWKGGASLHNALKIERLAAAREANGRPAAAARLRMLLEPDAQRVIDESAPFL